MINKFELAFVIKILTFYNCELKLNGNILKHNRNLRQIF